MKVPQSLNYAYTHPLNTLKPTHHVHNLGQRNRDGAGRGDLVWVKTKG